MIILCLLFPKKSDPETTHNSLIYIYGRENKTSTNKRDLQLTCRLTEVMRGSSVAIFVALQRYSALLSSGFRMKDTWRVTMLPVILVVPPSILSPANDEYSFKTFSKWSFKI